MVSICAWTLAFVFSALAGETPQGSLKKMNAVLNKDERIVNEQKMADLIGVELISVETSAQDIRVVPSDEEQIRIEFHGRTSVEYPIEVTREDRQLKIKLRKKLDRSIKWNVSFDSEEDKPLIGLKVMVPRRFGKEVQVLTASGDVHVDDLNLGTLSVTASSGDLEIYDSTAQSFLLKTVRGDIEVKKAHGVLVVESVSGDVKISDTIGDTLNVRDVTGDIRLDDVSAQTILGGTTSGDLRVRPKELSGWKFALKTTKGDVSNALSEDASGNKNMNLDSISGDIQVVR
jgi:DUF4097 and DUF4098 domain-containing protein YvlB